MIRCLSPLLLLWACADPAPETQDPTGPLWWTQTDPADPNDPTDPTDPNDPTDPDDPTVPVGDYHGQIPDDPLPPAVFAALNRDGTARTQAHLIGQPTALWFYPNAFTGG